MCRPATRRYRPCRRRRAPRLRDRPLVAHLAGARQRLVWSLGDLLERHADELAELEALDNGKPVTNARRDDVGGSIEMFRYMAGWATRLNGEQIPVSIARRLARLHPPRTRRGRRPDHPVEFSADDGGVETGAGPGGGMHDRAEARRADAALGDPPRRTDQRSRLSRRRRQHRHRLWRNRRRGARRASGRRQGRVHRLDRSRQADRQGSGGQPEAGFAGAGRQVARHRLPRRRSRTRDRRNGERDLLQPGPVLHGGLAAVRPQIGLRQDRRGRRAGGRQAEGRARPRSRRSISGRWSPRSSTTASPASSRPDARKAPRSLPAARSSATRAISSSRRFSPAPTAT